MTNRRFALPAALVALAAGLPPPALAQSVQLVPTACPFRAETGLAIIGAKSEAEGVDSEYAWIEANRPGWDAEHVATRAKAGRVYDLIRITRAGKSATICFDITAFWGKF